MNRLSRHGLLFALAGAALAVLAGGSGALWAQQGAAGPGQTVTLLVRGPDGAPLRSHALTEWRVGPFAAREAALTVPTDAQGRVTVTLTPDPQFGYTETGRLGVAAPGVGLGTTGVIEAGPDGRATVPLPPLAPFAHLSGTVAPQLRLPGESIHLDEFSQTGLPSQTVTVDAQGRFRLDDVPPGQAQLVAENDAGTRPGQGPRYYFGFHLVPGEVRTGVVLSPPKAAQFYDPTVSRPAPIPTRTVTLRGTVTDDQGRPVAGATVYAQVPEPIADNHGLAMSYSGPGRRPPPALTATTGADGGYAFADVKIGTTNVTIPVTVSAPGHAPAIVAATVAADAPGEVRADLVVSTRRTALTVRVIGQDGRPVASALVRLTPQARVPAFSGFGGFGGSFISIPTPPTAPESLFALSGGTGPDGAARFVDLLPGLYDVTASAGPVPFFSRPAPDYRSAESRGVAVQAGRVGACTLALAAGPVGPTVRVLGPDGRLVPVAQATLEPGRATLLTQIVPLVGPNRPSPSPTGDVPVQDYQLQTGLWHVGANYRDYGGSSGGYGNGIPEPYNEANALLALSPALPPPGLIVLHALHHGPGSLRVKLQDARGRPARGTVVIPGPGNEINYEASADARGEVVFAGLPSGDYTLQGYPAGQPPPSLADADMPPPPDAALTARPVLLPVKVTVTGEHEAAAVLRPRPIGYVRVTLRLTPPDTAKAYYIYAGDPAQTRKDEAAGTFLVGPLPPGPVTLYLSRTGPNGASASAGKVTVDVAPGGVTDTVIAPPPTTTGPRPDPTAILNGLRGTAGLAYLFRRGEAPTPPAAVADSPPAAAVYLSDGVTPAWGAEAVVCLPPSPNFQQPERADALGRLQTGTLLPPALRQNAVVLPTPPTGADPTTPTLVAWLPGLTGAALVPYTPGQAQKVTLPPALSVTGRVTVGGRSPAGLPGALRVHAEYQGRGRLNELLSVDVNAAPDGTFTLPGLTPGAYLVQAARDGIWLSTSQTLTVGGAPAPPLALDIGPAGAPVTLHLAPGQAVALDRPAGPLTEELWPPTVRADGAGALRLDGLEAGRHVVRPVGGGPAIAFDVPEPTSLLRGFLPKREDAEKSRQPHPLALLILPFREEPVSEGRANKEVGSGVLSGRVTDADGGPAAGVTVTARSTTYVSPGPAAQAVTGADGRYALHINTQADAALFGPDAPPALAYTVAPAPGGTLYVVPPDRTVTLTGTSRAAGADFVVTPGPQITVHVHDARTGKPVPGVPVEYPSIGGGDSPGDVAGVTDAQGVARFRSHELNVNLQIRARPDLTAAPGQGPYGMYKQYRLTPTDSVVWDVSVYGPTGPVSGTWRGVLLGPDGRPVPNAPVRRVEQQAGRPSITEQDVTDAEGRFTFPGTPLTAGDYRAGSEEDRLFADQGDAGAVLVPTPDEVARGITLRLVRDIKASVTGRVTDSKGTPLAGVPVDTIGAFRGDVTAPAPPATYRGGPAPDPRAYTDAAGRFTLTGLYPDAGYALGFGGPSYDVDARTGGASFGAHYFATTWYPPRGPDNAPVRLTLAAGERRDVGAVVVFRADATLAGRVVGPDGRPVVAPLAVEVDGAHANLPIFLKADGLFRAEHLAQEPLTLSVYRSHGGYSSDPKSPDLILRMPVTAGDQNVRVSIPAQPATPPPAPGTLPYIGAPR